jgi:cytochrome c-type biogenesis protein CcmH/NrfG
MAPVSRRTVILSAAALAVVGIALILRSGPLSVGADSAVAVSGGVPTMGTPVAPADLPPADVAGFEARLATLRAHVEANPDNGDLVLDLAQLLAAGHRMDEAVPLYRRALDLGISDPDARAQVRDALSALDAGGG